MGDQGPQTGGSSRARLRAVPARPEPAHPDVTIETKLHGPGVKREWVERPELVSYLASAAARLVLVEAPVGFGKTTLVAQWRASATEDRRFAWVTLDSGDDDPGRLWTWIIRALQRAAPGLDGSEILRALHVQFPDVAGTVLPLLINTLAGLSEPVVIVLDDYDVIGEASCHEQIAFLLLHLPPVVQVVLITRTSPPLPLARLRTAGDLVEVGQRELRFAAADAAMLVRAAAQVELSEPDLGTLIERTEGWPAGLYLAALSLRGHPSPSAFIRQFTGDNRFIVDLLAEEVLSHQPAEIQEFLLRTSVLRRFCAPLCDAVTGSANAAQLIDVLERENLFIIALDETRQWFRYHHLFAQALRSQLSRTEPYLVPVLHQRASAWHRQSGSTDEAITHALAAGDIAGAVDLIAQHWYSYVNSGRLATVSGWLRSLSGEQIAAHPLAAHCLAWVAATSGDQVSVRRWLPILESADPGGPLPDGMWSLEFSVALLGGAFGFDGIQAMRESAARAVELAGEPTSTWDTLALAAFGFSQYLSGEPAAAESLRQAAMSPVSIPLVRMIAFSIASLLAAEEGQLGRAKELASAARDLADDGGLSRAPQRSLAYTAFGAACALDGRLQEARAEFERALQWRRRWPGLSPWPTLETLLRLAALLLDVGDRRAATAHLDEARDVLTALPDGAEAQRARLDRLQRRIAAGQPPSTSLTGQLTEREATVLRLLPGTLSLREIGQQLDLSQNTIKTHAQAIYRKLGVSARNDAVQKARETGLI
jgi:LuxR family transcriptional regulator, maltose regulon positive regulatory protein